MDHESTLSGISGSSELETEVPLSRDILRGADQIAAYLYGDAKLRRKIYHLVQTGNLPVFKLGSILCARKSKLLRWIEEEEAKSSNRPTAPRLD